MQSYHECCIIYVALSNVGKEGVTYQKDLGEKTTDQWCRDAGIQPRQGLESRRLENFVFRTPQLPRR